MLTAVIVKERSFLLLWFLILLIIVWLLFILTGLYLPGHLWSERLNDSWQTMCLFALLCDYHRDFCVLLSHTSLL